MENNDNSFYDNYKSLLTGFTREHLHNCTGTFIKPAQPILTADFLTRQMNFNDMWHWKNTVSNWYYRALAGYIGSGFYLKSVDVNIYGFLRFCSNYINKHAV